MHDYMITDDLNQQDDRFPIIKRRAPGARRQEEESDEEEEESESDEDSGSFTYAIMKVPRIPTKDTILGPMSKE